MLIIGHCWAALTFWLNFDHIKNEETHPGARFLFRKDNEWPEVVTCHLSV